MIVPTSNLFKLAYGKYAIGAYNINNLEQALGLYWHGHYVHVPISLAVSARKQVDPKGDLWHSVIEATGQSPKFI
jgi:6-phosphofructokinase 1